MVNGLRYIIVRCSDVVGEREFYEKALGLEMEQVTPLNNALFNFPGGRFEVTGGGQVRPPVSDRRESPTTVVFSVDSVDATIARILDYGGSVIGEPFVASTSKVAYFCDPEGHVFGVAETRQVDAAGA